MKKYTLSHLSDAVLLRDLTTLVARDRATTADLLAHIAEVDARRLYAPAGYSSMFLYCVEELRLSEDAAYKRIQAARAGRQFPVLFEALAEGRLHLAAVCLLAPHLTESNVEDLVTAATHRRKAEIEDLLAQRFSPVASICESRLAPGQVADVLDTNVGEPLEDPEPCEELSPGQVGGQEPASLSSPVRRIALHLSVPESMHEKLAYAQALLSHAIPSGNVVELLDRALDALIEKVEKRKIGAESRREVHRTRVGKGTAQSRRYIPAQIRRAVWERDGGRCTFVSKTGHRCDDRRFLEFDHVEPVARGGTATVNGLRLRCRAHNQFEAERVFGAGFMNRKREEAIASAEQKRMRARAEQIQDVVAGLRGLGCRLDEARRAAEHAEGATLEECVRSALMLLSRRRVSSAPGAIGIRT